MADILGSDARDTIIGTEGADTLVGLAGDDDLIGLGGDDNLQGGDGDDQLEGGPGADQLNGGPGLDYAHYDRASTGLVVDLLLPARNTGEAAGDTFVGVEGIVGSAFDDELRGDDGRNVIFGSDGADTIFGRGGDDDLVGGPGQDAFYGGAGNDHIYPGGDDDYFVRLFGAHLIDGGDGFDFVHYENLSQRIQIDLRVSSYGYDQYVSIEGVVATNFDDAIAGTEDSNWIYGLQGNDYLAGFGGDDYLLGGPGGDSLDGGQGSDWLYGGEGNDSLDGGNGNDVLLGEAGNDRLVHSSGRDILDGGDGDDVLIPATSQEGYYYGGSGFDTVDYSSAGSYLITVIDLVLPGLNGTENHHYDSIEKVIGTSYGDSIRGNEAANILWGGGGDDVLYGRAGNDTLNGGTGSDVLFGNEGDDILTGDDVRLNGVSSYDGFYFGVGDGHDTITDFQAGVGLTDVLYLSTALGVNSFDQVMSHATQTNQGVLISLSANESILLTGLQLTSLVADDFGFF
jgi:Ca2+-binding RTX toxin-like protein